MSVPPDESKYRSGTPGRIDANGVEWWACDPYPTWYRWEGDVLHSSAIDGQQPTLPWVDES